MKLTGVGCPPDLIAGEGEDLEAVIAVPLVQAVQPLVIRLCKGGG